MRYHNALLIFHACPLQSSIPKPAESDQFRIKKLDEPSTYTSFLFMQIKDEA